MLTFYPLFAEMNMDLYVSCFSIFLNGKEVGTYCIIPNVSAHAKLDANFCMYISGYCITGPNK